MSEEEQEKLQIVLDAEFPLNEADAISRVITDSSYTNRRQRANRERNIWRCF